MPWNKDELARRVAVDLVDGWYVNLGIGLPMSIIGKIPEDREVVLQSENGILGVLPLEGEPNPDLVDAGKRPVSIGPGSAFFDSVLSFTMIRGGRIDVAVVGAYQVNPDGDLANWRNDSELVTGRIGGIGGAADIAVGARQLWVMMRHLTQEGDPKVVDRCRLPLTARGRVTRIYSDWAILDVTDGPLTVRELAPGITPDELQANTETELDLSGVEALVSTPGDADA